MKRELNNLGRDAFSSLPQIEQAMTDLSNANFLSYAFLSLSSAANSNTLVIDKNVVEIENSAEFLKGAESAYLFLEELLTRFNEMNKKE